MSDNNGVSTSTQTAQAPSWLLPYQQYGANQAYAAYQGVNSPTDLVAPFAPQQNQAISGITSLATSGTPGTGAAEDYVTRVLSGNPASNPYLDSMFERGANAVQNRLASEFAGSGRNVIGSLPVQADELNNLASQLYGGAYQTGVQQQEQALGEAVPLEQERLGLDQSLYNAGAAVQGLAQQYIAAPQNFLDRYLARVTGVPGQTTSTPVYMNNNAAMGGALLGGQLGNSINSTYGGLLGALAGGLLGEFA